MLLFLDLSYDEARRAGRLGSAEELDEAILHGAVKRARPKMMTVAAAFMGLLPIMWSTGTGADVMKRIAAPMVGGLVTSFLLELLVYPAIYYLWRRKEVTPGPAAPGWALADAHAEGALVPAAGAVAGGAPESGR
jgi:Cu(I)/Ag(I) efflux system membrane protein CusA/SilA